MLASGVLRRKLPRRRRAVQSKFCPKTHLLFSSKVAIESVSEATSANSPPIESPLSEFVSCRIELRCCSLHNPAADFCQTSSEVRSMPKLETELTRRNFGKLSMALLGGIVGGAIVGCAGAQDDGGADSGAGGGGTGDTGNGAAAPAGGGSGTEDGSATE